MTSTIKNHIQNLEHSTNILSANKDWSDLSINNKSGTQVVGYRWYTYVPIFGRVVSFFLSCCCCNRNKTSKILSVVDGHIEIVKKEMADLLKADNVAKEKILEIVEYHQKITSYTKVTHPYKPKEKYNFDVVIEAAVSDNLPDDEINKILTLNGQADTQQTISKINKIIKNLELFRVSSIDDNLKTSIGGKVWDLEQKITNSARLKKIYQQLNSLDSFKGKSDLLGSLIDKFDNAISQLKKVDKIDKFNPADYAEVHQLSKDIKIDAAVILYCEPLSNTLSGFSTTYKNLTDLKESVDKLIEYSPKVQDVINRAKSEDPKTVFNEPTTVQLYKELSKYLETKDINKHLPSELLAEMNHFKEDCELWKTCKLLLEDQSGKHIEKIPFEELKGILSLIAQGSPASAFHIIEKIKSKHILFQKDVDQLLQTVHSDLLKITDPTLLAKANEFFVENCSLPEYELEKLKSHTNTYGWKLNSFEDLQNIITQIIDSILTNNNISRDNVETIEIGALTNLSGLFKSTVFVNTFKNLANFVEEYKKFVNYSRLLPNTIIQYTQMQISNDCKDIKNKLNGLLTVSAPIERSKIQKNAFFESFFTNFMSILKELPQEKLDNFYLPCKNDWFNPASISNFNFKNKCPADCETHKSLEDLKHNKIFDRLLDSIQKKNFTSITYQDFSKVCERDMAKGLSLLPQISDESKKNELINSFLQCTKLSSNLFRMILDDKIDLAEFFNDLSDVKKIFEVSSKWLLETYKHPQNLNLGEFIEKQGKLAQITVKTTANISSKRLTAQSQVV